VSEGRAGEEASENPAAEPGSVAAAFRVALPNFEGPLDLLLHLIREHKVDIFDIPIALITEKYLGHLEAMREINLDIAGEFLVMAATLAQIKSRLLLPRQEVPADPLVEQEEQGDPRAELVRRLLEYQKYKDAASQLAGFDLLDRDVFTRKVAVEKIPIPDDEVGLAEISVYKLIEALGRVMDKLQPKFQHEVVRERLSLSEAIHKVVQRMRGEAQITFFSLFLGPPQTKGEIIITFLAVLEMCKLKLIRVYQAEDSDEILLSPKGDALEKLDASQVTDSDYQ
jgi:segregation and condensation protein A